MAHYDPARENCAVRMINQQRADGQTARLDLDTKGIYIYIPGRTVLTYPELDEDGTVTGTTVVTVHSGELITVQKTGFTDCKMILEPGRAHLATYDTPLGAMDMTVSALELSVRLGPDGGKLYLHYLLDADEGYAADNIMEITVSVL